MPNPKLLDDHQFENKPLVARWQLFLWSMGQALLGLMLTYLSLWGILYLDEWGGWLDYLGGSEAGPFLFVQIAILILPALNYWVFIPFLIIQKRYYPTTWQVLNPQFTWMLDSIYEEAQTELPNQTVELFVVFWYSVIAGLVGATVALVFMEIGHFSSFSINLASSLPAFPGKIPIIPAIIDLYWILFIIWGFWWYFKQWLPAWKSYREKQGGS